MNEFTRLSNRFDNRFDNRLYHVNGALAILKSCWYVYFIITPPFQRLFSRWTWASWLPWVSSSTCFGTEPLQISGISQLRAGCPSWNQINSLSALKETQSNAWPNQRTGLILSSLTIVDTQGKRHPGTAPFRLADASTHNSDKTALYNLKTQLQIQDFNRKASIRWQDSAPPRGSVPLRSDIKGMELPPAIMLIPLESQLTALQLWRWQSLYNETLQQTFRCLLTKLSKRRQT